MKNMGILEKKEPPSSFVHYGQHRAMDSGGLHEEATAPPIRKEA